jgi:hypothetical protein
MLELDQFGVPTALQIDYSSPVFLFFTSGGCLLYSGPRNSYPLASSYNQNSGVLSFLFLLMLDGQQTICSYTIQFLKG